GQETLLRYLKKKKRKSQITLARLTKKNVEETLQKRKSKITEEISTKT
ncbi:39479_t:CDS:1, partial [Gigaspora margarita]